jgi:hypothetical protein
VEEVVWRRVSRACGLDFSFDNRAFIFVLDAHWALFCWQGVCKFTGMNEKDFSKIETGLEVKLPEVFKAFVVRHGKELKEAAKTLADEVVWETSAARIVKLNKEVRKEGIEVGDEAEAAPWPGEYLALSDDGAGDHECIKLNDESGAVYEFSHEEGLFAKKFESPEAYLEDLRGRVKKFGESPAGKSEKGLVERAPFFTADPGGLNVPMNEMEPPVTEEKVRALGVDVERAKGEFAALLAAVSLIPREKWKIEIVAGKYPNQIRLSCATEGKSPKRVMLSHFQMNRGAMRLVVKTTHPRLEFDAGGINWELFHGAVRGLYEVFMRTKLRMTPGEIKAEAVTSAGYAAMEFAYVMEAG